MKMSKSKKAYVGSKDYFSGIINNLQEPIIVVDSNCNIVDANKSACTYLGREIENLIGQNCCGLSHPYDRIYFEKSKSCPCRIVLETMQQTRIIHEHHHPDGKTVWEEIMASPLKDKSGKVAYVVMELRDITELVKLKDVSDKLDAEIKIMRKFTPICASCKKIRNEEGNWDDVEHYIHELSKVEFTHTICPKCQRKLYPDQFKS